MLGKDCKHSWIISVCGNGVQRLCCHCLKIENTTPNWETDKVGARRLAVVPRPPKLDLTGVRPGEVIFPEALTYVETDVIGLTEEQDMAAGGYLPVPDVEPVHSTPICECGGSSANTTCSHWCPKYGGA